MDAFWGSRPGIVPCTTMGTTPPDTALYILRRNAGGVGGAELVVARFVRMFERTRDVTTLSEETLGLRHAPLDRLLPKWWRPVQYASRMDRHIRGLRPGLVLSLERGPRCTIYRAGDGAHRRWLEIKGGLWNWCNPMHWVLPHLERRSLDGADVVVANSEMVRRDLERFHPDAAGKIRVIHNGVDQSRFCWSDEGRHAVRASIGWTDEGTHWLFVGSGWARKGLQTAMQLVAHQAAQAEHLSTPPPTLHVAGRGRPEQYRSITSRLGIEHLIMFHGPQEDLHRWYRAADLMVLPTAYDPCSNATLEALACGCPVITTTTNGASEAISISEAGLVLDATCPDHDLVTTWLQSHQDPMSRRRIAESMANWTQEREQAAYESLFAELTQP